MEANWRAMLEQAGELIESLQAKKEKAEKNEKMNERSRGRSAI